MNMSYSLAKKKVPVVFKPLVCPGFMPIPKITNHLISKMNEVTLYNSPFFNPKDYLTVNYSVSPKPGISLTLNYASKGALDLIFRVLCFFHK